LTSFEKETWSVTLREEHGLRVFENRVSRKIFVPKRDEVTGAYISRVGERRSACRVLVGKPRGGGDHLEDLGIDKRVTLKWICNK